VKGHNGALVGITTILVVVYSTLGIAIWNQHRSSVDQIAKWQAQDLVTAQNITTSTFHQEPTYTFAPADDITAPELAAAIKILLPALICRNALGTGCDVTPAIEAAPPNVQRHFRRD
jgi:hypothetical protein